VHCSVRNGFVAALRETEALGGGTLQIFTQSPRGWRTRVYTDEEFGAFRRERERLGVGPVVVHSPYLPNLCTSLPELYDRSRLALRDDLDRCEKLDADYLVIHPGAYSPEADFETGVARLIGALNEALAVKGKTTILIENMAGGGRRIGGRFEEIARILDGVRDSKRVGVCFDTCHALGAGYDLSRPDAVDRTLQEFDRIVGLDRIRVFHVNDSRAPLGSHRDLHQHIGQGHIGLAGFQRIFALPAFRGLPLILETPKDSPTADPENLQRLKSCLPVP
jgi:deoxyribonuclease IV